MNIMYYKNKYGNWLSVPPKPYSAALWDAEQELWIDLRSKDDEWIKVRKDRGIKLNASDWTQLPDVPLATKEAWAAYRQQLRDVTLQPDPFNIVWPQPPQ